MLSTQFHYTCQCLYMSYHYNLHVVICEDNAITCAKKYVNANKKLLRESMHTTCNIYYNCSRFQKICVWSVIKLCPWEENYYFSQDKNVDLPGLNHENWRVAPIHLKFNTNSNVNLKTANFIIFKKVTLRMVPICR